MASLKNLLNRKVLKEIHGFLIPKKIKGYMTQSWNIKQTIKEVQSYKATFILLEC